VPLKTCRKGLHRYDAEHRHCPECQRAARARYLSSEKGRTAVARYRTSEKGRPTWRRQSERSRELKARQRPELALADEPLKGCRNGLHRYDPATAPKKDGYPRCPECLSEPRARWRRSEKGQASITRYRLSEQGRATYARYRQSAKGRAMAARYRRNSKQRRGPSGAA